MITKQRAEYLQNTQLGDQAKAFLQNPRQWNLLWAGDEIKMLDKNHPVYKLIRGKYPSAYIVLKPDNSRSVHIVYDEDSEMFIDFIPYKKARKILKEIKISNLK